jgi:hypothetical protein
MEVSQVTINNVTFNRTGSEESWRLVHDGVRVILLEEMGGVLNTQLNVFLANSKEACLTEIYRLNLIYELPEAPKAPEVNYKP